MVGLLSLPSCLLLRNISALLNAFGISEEVSQAAQEYCYALSYGVMPSFLCVSDLCLAEGNKQPQIVLVVNTTHAVLSTFLSYALALGRFGFPRLGIAGLGYGDALANWLSFIGLRLYYKFSRQYDEFKLFDWHLPDIKDISALCKVGLPIGLNDALSSVNAVILSLLAGKLGKEVSVAQAVSSIPLSAFHTLLMGLVLATTIEVANSMGELKAAQGRDEEAALNSLQQNVKRIGNAGLLIGLSLACCACLLFTGFSKQISEIFLDTSQDIPKETLPLAQVLLSINSVGLIIDTLKDISASNLLSMQDTLFALLLNTGGSLLGLSAGAYLSRTTEKAEWLFMSQVLGNLIAALAITHRWLKKSNFNQNSNVDLNTVA
jgi:MATE family multidrug resistance protein